jgi:hypothetical protein
MKNQKKEKNMSIFLMIGEVLFTLAEILILGALVVGLMSVSVRVKNIEKLLTLILTLEQQKRAEEDE